MLKRWLLAVVMGMVVSSVGVAQGDTLPPVPAGLERALDYYAKTGQAQQQLVDGVLMLPYGVGRPEILCAPFQICSLQLEPGEVIRNKHIGNQATWWLDQGGVGQKGSKSYVQSIVLKPFLCDLETSLVVFTNKRQYHLTLRSLPCGDAVEQHEMPETAWVPRTAFWYPQESLEAWSEQEVVEAAAVEAAQLADRKPEQAMVCVRHHYKVRAKRRFPWEPTAVCDDGEHTYIGVPKGTAELGILYAKGASGDTILNYTVHSTARGRFIRTEHLVEEGSVRIGRTRGKDAVLTFVKVGEE